MLEMRMINFKVVGIVVFALFVSRFIPHPPNFTALIALSFYIPLIFGVKYISIVLVAFVLTDVFIGLHSTIFLLGYLFWLLDFYQTNLMKVEF